MKTHPAHRAPTWKHEGVGPWASAGGSDQCPRASARGSDGRARTNTNDGYSIFDLTPDNSLDASDLASPIPRLTGPQ
jgi:hypothetical protein